MCTRIQNRDSSLTVTRGVRFSEGNSALTLEEKSVISLSEHLECEPGGRDKGQMNKELGLHVGFFSFSISLALCLF